MNILNFTQNVCFHFFLIIIFSFSLSLTDQVPLQMATNYHLNYLGSSTIITVVVVVAVK